MRDDQDQAGLVAFSPGIPGTLGYFHVVQNGPIRCVEKESGKLELGVFAVVCAAGLFRPFARGKPRVDLGGIPGNGVRP